MAGEEYVKGAVLSCANMVIARLSPAQTGAHASYDFNKTPERAGRAASIRLGLLARQYRGGSPVSSTGSPV